MSSSSSPSPIDRINAYYEDYSDSTEFIGKSYDRPEKQATSLEKGVKDLIITEIEEAYRKEKVHS